MVCAGGSVQIEVTFPASDSIIPAAGLPRLFERQHIRFRHPRSSPVRPKLSRLRFHLRLRARRSLGGVRGSGRSRSRLPFRATMLRLLRLRCFPPSHDENSRNPALSGVAMLISPMKEHKEKKRFVFVAFPGFGSTLSGVSAGWQNLPRSKDGVFRPPVSGLRS